MDVTAKVPAVNAEQLPHVLARLVTAHEPCQDADCLCWDLRAIESVREALDLMAALCGPHGHA